MAENKAQQTSSESNVQQSQSGQQNIQRSQQRGGLARRGDVGTDYFPSPAEFFTNPFGVMRRFHEDMDRAFAQALGGGMMSAGDAGEGGARSASWAPLIEVKQQGNNLVVCAELPGLKPEEVHVEVNDNVLILRGERRNESTRDEGSVHRTERRYGQFYRAIPLPEGVQAEDAKASFQNGVLEVTMPIPEQQSKRRQIPISSGSASESPNVSADQKGSKQMH